MINLKVEVDFELQIEDMGQIMGPMIWDPSVRIGVQKILPFSFIFFGTYFGLNLFITTNVIHN